MLLSATLLVMPWDPDSKRWRLCLLTGLAAVSCLTVISFLNSRYYWYAAPVLPLAAVAIGVSTSTWLRGGGSWAKSIVLRHAMVGLPIVLALAASFWFLNIRWPTAHSLYSVPDQVWYGSFMAQFPDPRVLDGIIVLDRGVPYDGDSRYFSPIARFFLEEAERHGIHMRLLTTVADLPENASVLSCDSEIRQWLASQKSFSMTRSDAHCVFGNFP
jgi:hypothetical protein